MAQSDTLVLEKRCKYIYSLLSFLIYVFTKFFVCNLRLLSITNFLVFIIATFGMFVSH